MDFVGNIHGQTPPPPPAYPGRRQSEGSEVFEDVFEDNEPPTTSLPTANVPITTSTPHRRPSSSGSSRRSSGSATMSMSDMSSTYRTPESFWYKPNMSRDEAIRLLKGGKAGDFFVRDSKTYEGSFGLVVRVDRHQVPQAVFDNLRPEQDPQCELVRHFLIDSVKQKGVRISGDDRREPFFPSLAALIHQHSHSQLALPVKLNVPLVDISMKSTSGRVVVDGPHHQTDTFSTFFIHEADTEMLTGRAAMSKCFTEFLRGNEADRRINCPVHLKVTPDGVTVTDSQRKKFFRKHFPSDSISYCDVDPKGEVFEVNGFNSRVFGLVSKKANRNSCILLAEKDLNKAPADAIIHSINKIMTRQRILDLNSPF